MCGSGKTEVLCHSKKWFRHWLTACLTELRLFNLYWWHWFTNVNKVFVHLYESGFFSCLGVPVWSIHCDIWPAKSAGWLNLPKSHISLSKTWLGELQRAPWRRGVQSELMTVVVFNELGLNYSNYSNTAQSEHTFLKNVMPKMYCKIQKVIRAKVLVDIIEYLVFTWIRKLLFLELTKLYTSLHG